MNLNPKWNAKLVEELLKRLDNQLNLPYNLAAKDFLLQALIQYNNTANEENKTGSNKLVNNLYKSPVLQDIINKANASSNRPKM